MLTKRHRVRPGRVLHSLKQIDRKNRPPIPHGAMMASKEQKWVLLNLLNEHKEVIFAKLSASCTKDTKQAVWMHIYEECMRVGYPLPADANWRYFRDITWPNLRKQAYKKLEERNQAEAMGKVEVYVNDINQMVLNIMGLGGGGEGPSAPHDSNSTNPEQMADSSGYTGDIQGCEGGMLDDSSMVEERGSFVDPPESDGHPVDFLGFSTQHPKSEPLSPGFSKFHPNQNNGGGTHVNEFNSVDSNDQITYHATLTGEVFDNAPIGTHGGTPKSQIVYQYQDSGASPPSQRHSSASPQSNIRSHSVGGSNGAAAAIAEYQLAPSPHKMDASQSSGGTQHLNVKYNPPLYSQNSNLYSSNHRATQLGGSAGSPSPRLPVNASGATISTRQKAKPVAMAAAMTSSGTAGDFHASSLGSHGGQSARYHPYRQSQTAASHAPTGSGSNLSPPGSGNLNQQQSQFEIMNSLKIDREQAELELTRLKSYRLKLEIFQMEQSMGVQHAFDLKY